MKYVFHLKKFYPLLPSMIQTNFSSLSVTTSYHVWMEGVLVAQRVILIIPYFKVTNIKNHFGKFFQAEEHTAPLILLMGTSFSLTSKSTRRRPSFGNLSRDRSCEAAGVEASHAFYAVGQSRASRRASVRCTPARARPLWCGGPRRAD